MISTPKNIQDELTPSAYYSNILSSVPSSSLICPTNSMVDDVLLTPVVAVPKGWDEWLNKGQEDALDLSPGTPIKIEAGLKDPLKDLPMDSEIGLRSPCDGLLAKRRKQMREMNKRTGSFNSDSNSCDTPTYESSPRDLTMVQKKSLSEDQGSRDDKYNEGASPCVRTFESSSLPSPKNLTTQRLHQSSRQDQILQINPSPLAVPSPNWTAVEHYFGVEPIKTPKNLDTNVFDFLGHLPSTPKSGSSKVKDKSPNLILDNYFGHDKGLSPRLSPRYPIPELPTDLSRRPVPKIVQEEQLVQAQDLSTKKSRPESLSLDPHSNPPQKDASIPKCIINEMESLQKVEDFVKKSPSKPSSLAYSSTPKNHHYNENFGFSHSVTHSSYIPAYFHHGNIPDSDHLSPFWSTFPRQDEKFSYDDPNWNSSLNHSQLFSNQYQSMYHSNTGNNHSWSGYVKHETPCTATGVELYMPKNFEAETKSLKDKKNNQDEKRPRGRIKKHPVDDLIGGGQNKRQYVCQHCQRSYDWNYNLNRHLKYECGKENSFQCSQCCRKFPHKQNCVYHLKRKHKIVYETIDQYMTAGLVIFRGPNNESRQQIHHHSRGPSCPEIQNLKLS